ncbi:hypothetical protein [uncultured Jatrophihabitans sp.]|uniref:hypothetical protein n=1 Tax=uncultured Jatrophihabitans sp. TaxID=1610747 RepID=UPI0035CA238D
MSTLVTGTWDIHAARYSGTATTPSQVTTGHIVVTQDSWRLSLADVDGGVSRPSDMTGNWTSNSTGIAAPVNGSSGYRFEDDDGGPTFTGFTALSAPAHLAVPTSKTLQWLPKERSTAIDSPHQLDVRVSTLSLLKLTWVEPPSDDDGVEDPGRHVRITCTKRQ